MTVTNVVARITNNAAVSSTVTQITLYISFIGDGVAYFIGTSFNITTPNILTAAAYNLAVQCAVADYLSDNYGTVLSAQVILLGGVVAV